MAHDISKVSVRQKLKTQREPYWLKLASGSYVGFRKMTASDAGTWVARYWDAGKGKQEFATFGKLDDLPDGQRFDQACKLAREWLGHLGTGGSNERVTVLAACHSYAQHIEESKSAKAAADLRARYARWIEGAPIGNIELTKLTREHVKSWRSHLVKTPVVIGKSGVTRERSKETVNRDLTALRAALNYAKDNRQATSDFAWQLPLKPFKNAGKRRTTYLPIEERRRLLEHASGDIAHFIRGLCIVPLRPGALAQLQCSSFSIPLQTLTVGKDKSGENRDVKLKGASSQFFTDMCSGKAPSDFIFTREGATAWNKDAWKDPIKNTAVAAGLPSTTVAMTLRHSVITDLVVDGLDLFTVAKISGTSVAMIEKHYGHLRNDIASAALEKQAI